MLITKIIFQSPGILIMFKIKAKNGSKESPNPIRIKFLSRKFSEFFTNEETVKPKQYV